MTTLHQYTFVLIFIVIEPTCQLSDIANVCEDFVNGTIGLVADPQNCTRYFMCFEFEPINFPCAPGYAFDDSTKRCVLADLVNCTD